MDWQPIIKQIEAETNQCFTVLTSLQVTGGDINSTYKLLGANKSYFVKLNLPDLLPMFEAERAGLVELSKTQTVRIPSAIACGSTNAHSFLVLENIDFGKSSLKSDRILGQQLAHLHLLPQPYFGWHRHNTIGSTPQPNNRCESWLTFWREQRLCFQLKLAANKGYGGRLQTSGDQLLSDMDAFFTDNHAKPALLHGDLWAGNAAVDECGNPVIFDPACYYGDRETDLAMTELFGGYSQDFYAAYQDNYPLDKNYSKRKPLYNLYHLLNHLNLFGRSYLRQCENIISMLLAELS
jgi:protein-ribulosamine 3-kinase